MASQNQPVELATFAVLFLGGLQGLGVVWRVKKHGEGILVS
jgi:hypothetical protein